MKSPNLKFTMPLRESRYLETGTLELFDGEKRVNGYKATSSYPGKQYPASWREKGGVIPPDEPYLVTVQPIWLPNVRGVEGNFYVITPYNVDTIGDKRGDFGIHRDTNAPGSLGCIVLTTDRGWIAFQRDMITIASAGIREQLDIPLAVSYC